MLSQTFEHRSKVWPKNHPLRKRLSGRRVKRSVAVKSFITRKVILNSCRIVAKSQPIRSELPRSKKRSPILCNTHQAVTEQTVAALRLKQNFLKSVCMIQ